MLRSDQQSALGGSEPIGGYVAKENVVHIETVRNSTRPHMLQLPRPSPGAREPDDSRSELSARSSDPTVHDATLLVAALEDLEAKRVAIEWLLDADLLCVCLV